MSAKISGIEMVPVYIDRFTDPRKAYLDINNTIRPPTSREWLQTYLAGGKVPAKLEAEIKRIERACGKDAPWRIAQANLSPKSLIQVAVSAIKYIGGDSNDDALLKKIIFWMIDGRRQWQVRAAIFYGHQVPIDELSNAINENRDIDLTKIQ